jgi:hypothetical protein
LANRTAQIATGLSDLSNRPRNRPLSRGFSAAPRANGLGNNNFAQDKPLAGNNGKVSDSAVQDVKKKSRPKKLGAKKVVELTPAQKVAEKETLAIIPAKGANATIDEKVTILSLPLRAARSMFKFLSENSRPVRSRLHRYYALENANDPTFALTAGYAQTLSEYFSTAEMIITVRADSRGMDLFVINGKLGVEGSPDVIITGRSIDDLLQNEN